MNPREPLAIVAMAARLPGADDLADLCEGLTRGAGSRRVPPARWTKEHYQGPDGQLADHDRGHFITDVFSFDHVAFQIPRDQALQLDPQQRMMLEVGRVALDHAGLLAATAEKDVGVFVGARMNSYGFDASAERGRPPRDVASAALWGRSPNFIATWLSDRFDLTGPAVVVDSACSSSLMALWTASMAVRNRECAAALVGGVDLLIDPLTFTLLSQAGALSLDGESKTFDRSADGYGPGEGAGAIVLMPLEEAEANGLIVHGVLLDIHANNDGRTMGVTTPNPDAQRTLLDRVYSEVDPCRLGYVETHGTGTLIGDPIEVQALTDVFGTKGVPHQTVALHSLKRRIGHLHSAAGLAGVINAVVNVRAGNIPITSGLNPNPRLGIDDSPLYIPTDTGAVPQRPWDAVGVSAFGFGGTNVHAVLASRCPSFFKPADPSAIGCLLLSAPTAYQLRELAAQWINALREAPQDEIPSMLDAQRDRRKTWASRFGIVATLDQLADRLERALLTGQVPRSDRVRSQIALGSLDHSPTRWINELRMQHERIAADLSAIESVAGLAVPELPEHLLRPIALLVASAGLAEAGVPHEAIDLGLASKTLRSYGWDRLTIHEALPELLHGTYSDPASDPVPVSPGVTVLETLHRSEDATTALALTLVRAFEADHDVARPQHSSQGPCTSVPTWQYTGPSLNLGEPRRNSPSGGDTVTRQETDGWMLERTFAPRDPEIALHEVHGTSMLPGVGWIPFVINAATQHDSTISGIADLVFDRPLVINHPTLVQGSVNERLEFRIHAGNVRLARGKLVAFGDLSKHSSLDLAEITQCASHVVSGSRLYRWLRRLGYYHGRQYRNLSWIASTPTGTLARIEGQRLHDIDPEHAHLPTGILDSVTIAAIDPASSRFETESAEIVIPISIGAVELYGSLSQAAYVVTTTKHLSKETHRFDQHVTDENGSIILSLLDISSKRVPDNAFRAEEPRVIEESRPLPADPPSQESEPATLVASEYSTLASWLGAQLSLRPEDFDQEFLALGMNSAELVEVSERIGALTQVDLYPTIMFEYPTVEAFAGYLKERGATVPEKRSLSGEVKEPAPAPVPAALEPRVAGQASEEHAGPAPCTELTDVDAGVHTKGEQGHGSDPMIVITGVGLHVATAESLNDLWSIIRDGESRIGPAPISGAGRHAGLGPGCYLPEVDTFDPEPFRLSRREAPIIDPQARIVYETILHAVEDAGGTRTSSVGLWIGYSHDHYYEERVRTRTAEGRGLGLEAMIANRLSYVMNWTGPSSVVNTLCSSGLVALHQARRALQNGECDMAVVAGVQAALSPSYFASMSDLGALSKKGESRPFDEEAAGFVPGEGAVAIVLQPMERAIRQGRRIRGRILGSAINHNGRTSRYSAPSAHGQREVIRAALEDAGVDPVTIGLVEAHGTGTVLGDPIEVDGITQAWREYTDRIQFCALGSLKSTVGHLEPAAGLASLAKLLAAMEHETIPPTLNVVRPNDRIRFERTPFYLPLTARPWKEQRNPRRGAVSSFGLGGANAHVLIEEHPKPEPSFADSDSPMLIRITGATPTAVEKLASLTRRQLLAQPEAAKDISATMTAGREAQKYRIVATGTIHEVIEALDSETLTDRIHRHPKPSQRPVFVFPGQGSQSTGMGLRLAEQSADFRRALEEVDAEASLQGIQPMSELWQMPAERLALTQNAQPAIVGFQAALTLTLNRWGILPAATVGHSIGELTAAWAAGAMDLATLLEIVNHRATAMGEIPAGGAMAACWSAEEHVATLLEHYPGVEIAAINSSRVLTLSGPPEAIDRFAETSGLRTQRLKVSHAFHSVAMTHAGDRLADVIAIHRDRGSLRQPIIPCAATCTSGWHDEETMNSPQLWSQSVTGPVRFADALRQLAAHGHQLFLEISPTKVLTTVGQQTLPESAWIAPPPTTSLDLGGVLALVKHLSPHLEPEWQAICGRWHTVDAPLYPYERDHFWVGEEDR